MPTLDELEARLGKPKVAAQSSLDDLDALLGKQGTTTADKLFTHKTLPDTLLPGPMDVAGAVARGFNRGIAGIPQAVGDLVAPEATSRLTDMFNKWNAPPTQDRPYTEAIGGFVGELGAQAGAQALVPEVGLLQGSGLISSAIRGGVGGGATGALSYEPSTDADARLYGRELAGAAGAAGGAVIAPVARLGTKLSNAKQITKDVDSAVATYAKNDPSIADMRAGINEARDRLTAQFSAKSEQVLKAGDALGPLNTNDMAEKLRAAAAYARTGLNPDAKSKKLMDNVVKQLAPEAKLPDKLTVGGRDFLLDLTTGGYSASGVALPQNVVTAALDSMGKGKPQELGYRQLARSAEELDSYLKDTTKGDPATVALRKMRDTIQGQLDAVKSPRMTRLENSARGFYKDNLARYDEPVVQRFLAEQDPLKAANIVIEAATSKDAGAAADLAKMLGPGGRDAVRGALVKKALDSSVDKGSIDAVKFMQFFDAKGAQPFVNNELRRQVAGIKNLLSETALRQGESTDVKLTHPGGFAFAPGMYALSQGQMSKAAVEMSAAMLATPVFKNIEHILKDRYGRSLLSAAADVRPGSPRMARIMQALGRRFLPQAGGVGAAELAGQQ